LKAILSIQDENSLHRFPFQHHRSDSQLSAVSQSVRRFWPAIIIVLGLILKPWLDWLHSWWWR